MSYNVLFWILFNLFILLLLLLDLGLFHRQVKIHTLKHAFYLSFFWIGIALVFNAGIYFIRGKEDALSFFTGYLIEYALSIDNLFIFLLIFSYFKVPKHLTHKVLFWGVIGAALMRALFILGGIALITRFHGMVYIFGVFLVYTGIKLVTKKENSLTIENNFILNYFKKFIPITQNFVKDHFFVKEDSILKATPLFVVLLAIETSDLIFALDSIPAIIGITQDPFIVYTSNIFAILGLRTLYVVLEKMMGMFHFLHYGLGIILCFVGLKMLGEGIYSIPIGISLGVILVILSMTIGISLLKLLMKSKKQ